VLLACRLTDFGFAGVLREGVTHHSTQNLGTISHCAPEVLQSGRMSPAADVYAFAILSECQVGWGQGWGCLGLVFVGSLYAARTAH
jgi:serine/threonine protein kinase